MSFDLKRLDSNGGAALSPQGPLVALTNGTLILVYAGSFSLPTASFSSYSVALASANWKVTNSSGVTATDAQLSSVMSSLTGVYILGDFVTLSGSNGEVIGLDNVSLASPRAPVPEPSAAWLLAIGLCAAGLTKRLRKI